MEKGLFFEDVDYYRRENSVENMIKFQGQEHIDDLNLRWVSFKWRNHMPDVGRFFNVDPLVDKHLHNSPYAFSENRLISVRELEGLEGEISITGPSPYGQVTAVVRNQQRREELIRRGDSKALAQMRKDEVVGGAIGLGMAILPAIAVGAAPTFASGFFTAGTVSGIMEANDKGQRRSNGFSTN